jgi:hypothetical protein
MRRYVARVAIHHPIAKNLYPVAPKILLTESS